MQFVGKSGYDANHIQQHIQLLMPRIFKAQLP